MLERNRSTSLGSLVCDSDSAISSSLYMVLLLSVETNVTIYRNNIEDTQQLCQQLFSGKGAKKTSSKK
jgi:hypothetical protein